MAVWEYNSEGQHTLLRDDAGATYWPRLDGSTVRIAPGCEEAPCLSRVDLCSRYSDNPCCYRRMYDKWQAGSQHDVPKTAAWLTSTCPLCYLRQP